MRTNKCRISCFSCRQIKWYFHQHNWTHKDWYHLHLWPMTIVKSFSYRSRRLIKNRESKWLFKLKVYSQATFHLKRTRVESLAREAPATEVRETYRQFRRFNSLILHLWPSRAKKSNQLAQPATNSDFWIRPSSPWLPLQGLHKLDSLNYSRLRNIFNSYSSLGFLFREICPLKCGCSRTMTMLFNSRIQTHFSRIERSVRMQDLRKIIQATSVDTESKSILKKHPRSVAVTILITIETTMDLIVQMESCRIACSRKRSVTSWISLSLCNLQKKTISVSIKEATIWDELQISAYQPWAIMRQSTPTMEQIILEAANSLWMFSTQVDLRCFDKENQKPDKWAI